MTKIQLLATLLALFIFAMLGACSNEDYPEPDVFKVTPDLRTRINTGIKMASRTEKRLFNETFNSFLHKCDEMGSENTPYQYMETEEYADLKKLILSSSPATCYLLMDRYLKRNPPFFSFILNDLIDASYSTSSNVDNAYRLKGKLLLINGELDDNVDPASTLQVVSALMKANKNFEQLYLPGKTHSLGGPFEMHKMHDFFVKNLLGQEPPEWE